MAAAGEGPAARPREQAGLEEFSLQDDDDDAEAEEAEAGGQNSCRRESVTGPRLSLMFEHNDLINNRISALAGAIREGPLPPPRRVSALRGRAGERELEEEEEERPGGGTERGEESGSEDTAGAGAGERAACARCAELERALQGLLAENASLRAQLRERAAAEAAAAAPAAATEGPAAPAAAAAEEGAGAAPRAARATVSAGALAKASHWRTARRQLKFERSQQRREQQEAQAPRAQLRKAESIIERLVDEIELLTVGPRATASGAAPCAEEESSGFIGDLKSAINGFFGGVGHAATGHVDDELAQQVVEPPAARRRAETEPAGGRPGAGPPEPFL